jgi:shikimate kinase / 3-dehydroquinate synthase
MHNVRVELGERSYDICIGSKASASSQFLELIHGRRVLVVSDETVGHLHAHGLILSLKGVAAQCLQLSLPLSESSKVWANVERIVTYMLEHRFDRKSLIVALGGGVVGDVAGFAASVYQRGVDFVQMPTTLLSMVDSSVGGKTGINHELGKNMIGAFYQPQMVVADLDFLQTLPSREISAGLAEIIKHGAIADPAYLSDVQQRMTQLRDLNPVDLASVIARSCEIKANIVGQDERESGLRALLNFGHTFGHAIETGMGYGQWLHGEAVGAGMVLAANLSVKRGYLDGADEARLVDVIAQAGLPTKAPTWSIDRYIELMSVDKKAEAGTPKFILLKGLGAAVFERVPDNLLRETLAPLAPLAPLAG